MLRQGRDTVLRHFSWTIMLQTGSKRRKERWVSEQARREKISYSLKAFFRSHKRRRKFSSSSRRVRNRFLAAKEKKCKKLVQKENESNFLTWKTCQHVKVTKIKIILIHTLPKIFHIFCLLRSFRKFTFIFFFMHFCWISVALPF